MAKIKLLDILQKNHKTGLVILMHKLECNLNKGKIELLNQILHQDKDNEVLSCSHVSELEKLY